MSIPFGQLFQLKINMVIPLTHHKKNSDLAELKVVGGYLSPAAGGGKISCDQLSFCLPHFQQVC